MIVEPHHRQEKAGGRINSIRMGEHGGRSERMRADHCLRKIYLPETQVDCKSRKPQGGTRHVHPHVGGAIDETEVNCQNGRPDERRSTTIVKRRMIDPTLASATQSPQYARHSHGKDAEPERFAPCG